jgi:hypothetical protein
VSVLGQVESEIGPHHPETDDGDVSLATHGPARLVVLSIQVVDVVR